MHLILIARMYAMSCMTVIYPVINVNFLSQRVCNVAFWCLFWFGCPEHTIEQITELPVTWDAMTKIGHDYMNKIIACQKNYCQTFSCWMILKTNDSYMSSIEYLLIRKHETDFVHIFQIQKRLWYFRSKNIVNHNICGQIHVLPITPWTCECWFLISGVLWHPPEGNSTLSA